MILEILIVNVRKLHISPGIHFQSKLKRQIHCFHLKNYDYVEIKHSFQYVFIYTIRKYTKITYISRTFRPK